MNNGARKMEFGTPDGRKDCKFNGIIFVERLKIFAAKLGYKYDCLFLS